jgi:hypothetical protein
MILNLGFLILFTLAFFGIGRRLLSLFGEEKLDLSEKIFFSLGLGIGFLGNKFSERSFMPRRVLYHIGTARYVAILGLVPAG